MSVREEQAKWGARLLVERWPGGWRSARARVEDDEVAFTHVAEQIDVEAAITGFARQARSRFAAEREDAVAILDDLDSDRPIAVFLRALSDPDVWVRRRAAIALAGRCLPGWTIERLVGAILDEDPVVRARACEALGRTARARQLAEKHLLERLQDEAPTVRSAAVVALARLGSERARALRDELERDVDPRVRACARSALSSSFEPEWA